MEVNPKLAYSIRGMTKRFPGVIAIDHADLDVRQGEIHGIIGKNGAGKSVLMTLIAGITKANEGSIDIRNNRIDVNSYSPLVARNLGVALIPQEPAFFPYMSVVDNLFLDNEIKRKSGLLNQSKMAEKVLEIAERMSVKVSPLAKMNTLPLEDQQLINFGKAMFINMATTILLDEITASLTQERKAQLLAQLRRAIQDNPEISFTLISHSIAEIMEFCDRVTILRDGRVVTTVNISETNPRELADYIVGDNIKSINDSNPKEIHNDVNRNSKPLLGIKNICNKKHFNNICFDLFKGQVIGLAGLDGSGKYEFLEALTGLLRIDDGKIEADGIELKIASPTIAMAHGIAYLPKKREEQAVIHNRSVEENILISIYERISNAFGWIDFKKAGEIVEANIKAMNIKTPSRSSRIDNLSGGNRQKVVLNRIINTNPKIYLLNEPTRGVDVATKPEILATIRNVLTEESGVILTIESEEELIEVSDMIAVFYKGEIKKCFYRGNPDFNFAEVYKASQGVGLS